MGTKKFAKAVAATAPKSANLAYTMLAPVQQKAVRNICTAAIVIGTKTDYIGEQMALLFPTRKVASKWEVYKPIMSALKQESNNGLAYRAALQWFKKTFGGLCGANNVIVTDAVRAKNGQKGMTLFRAASALDAKFDAFTSYVAKIPVALIEPDALAHLTALVETMTKAKAEFDAYIEMEKAEAEAASVAAAA